MVAINNIQEEMTTFLEFLKFEKRYSFYTLRSYSTDLKDFSLFLASTYDLRSVKEIAPKHIRSWLAQLKAGELSNRSVNRKLSSIRSWFKYLFKQEKITVNPTVAIQSLKIKKRLPSYLEPSATQSLFHRLEFPDDFSGWTERLILEILYDTGMRRSELIQLKDRDVDWERRLLKVLGKGNKERLIPLGVELLDFLKVYIGEKKEKFGSTERLLVTSKGNPLYPQLVYRTVKKWLSLVTTIKKRSPHVLRHTFATHLLNNGADLNAIRELLGHANLAATQIYTHNSIAELKKVYDQAHPKSGK